MRLLAFQHQ